MGQGLSATGLSATGLSATGLSSPGLSATGLSSIMFVHLLPRRKDPGGQNPDGWTNSVAPAFAAWSRQTRSHQRFRARLTGRRSLGCAIGGMPGCEQPSLFAPVQQNGDLRPALRSEEHTSEL